MLDAMPARRAGRVKDALRSAAPGGAGVASVVAFLASDAASYITGAGDPRRLARLL